MELSILFKGLIAGITIAVPLGPVNLICIQRTLNDGHMKGLVSGLGAALADTLYGFIAGFGLTIVTSFLFDNLPIVKLVGGIVVIALGVRILFVKPKVMRKIPEISTKSLWRAFSSTFAITLTNPITIMVFIGIFASLGLGEHGTKMSSSLILIVGIFLGSLIWWVILSSVVNKIRHKFNPRLLHNMNRISGSGIVLFGLVLIITSVLEFARLV